MAHVSSRRKYSWWRISHLAVRAWQLTRSLNTSHQSWVCRISRPHFQSGLKMRLGRAGCGGVGKARMVIGERIGGDDVPNLDTFCSVSSDGWKLQPRFGDSVTFDHVSRSIPHNPNFHNTATCLYFVWGRWAFRHAGS